MRKRKTNKRNKISNDFLLLLRIKLNSFQTRLNQFLCALNIGCCVTSILNLLKKKECKSYFR